MNKIEELQAVINSLLNGKKSIKALEAGCGSMSNINLGPNAYIVGIDVSERQLKNNTVIHEKILGDIQTYKLPKSEYDVIFCWDVLEHLSRPQMALLNFVKAIKENGIIVLSFPNVFSLKSIVAKITPYRFHRWVYNLIYGKKFGTAGYEPFPTYLRYSIAPALVKRFAWENGLSIEHYDTFESGLQRKFRERYGLVRIQWQLAKTLVKLLSLGIFDAEATDYIIVLRRQ